VYGLPPSHVRTELVTQTNGRLVLLIRPHHAFSSPWLTLEMSGVPLQSLLCREHLGGAPG
jgi:hypothetical protein